MVVGARRVALRRVGFVSWLGVVYIALLYLGVGALGVSEVVSRYGDQAAMIFHVVSIVDTVRNQEKQALGRLETKQVTITEQLGAAIDELRRFGISTGLPLDKIQPVIDNYDYSPRLETLMGSKVEAAAEQDWADRVARVVMLQGESKRLQGEIDKCITLLRRSWASEFDLKSSDGKGRVLTNSDIEMAAGTAVALQRLGYDLLFMLPQELLTLVLALSMGGLGSTLHVTKSLVEGVHFERASYYVVRPVQGMVTALVMYVVLKAGQLTISTDAATGLNHFFVAFAGIVSGLMSQQAYGMIERAGAALLKSDEDQPRWAFKLKDHLAAAAIAPETLASGIAVSAAEMHSWMTEKQPVPGKYQRLIAVWLHTPERELFTSLAPDSGGNAPEPTVVVPQAAE